MINNLIFILTNSVYHVTFYNQLILRFLTPNYMTKNISPLWWAKSRPIKFNCWFSIWLHQKLKHVSSKFSQSYNHWVMTMSSHTTPCIHCSLCRHWIPISLCNIEIITCILKYHLSWKTTAHEKGYGHTSLCMYIYCNLSRHHIPV